MLDRVRVNKDNFREKKILVKKSLKKIMDSVKKFDNKELNAELISLRDDIAKIRTGTETEYVFLNDAGLKIWTFQEQVTALEIAVLMMHKNGPHK